jgi:hypothetical protein
MITPAESAGLFQWKNVGRFLDDAEQIGRTRIIPANFAKLLRGKESAKFTWMNLGARFRNGACDLFRLIVARLDHPERNAFGGARPNPWHLSQLRDQITNRLRVICSFQIKSATTTRSRHFSSDCRSAWAYCAGDSIKCKASGSRRRRYRFSGASSSLFGARAFWNSL